MLTSAFTPFDHLVNRRKQPKQLQKVQVEGNDASHDSSIQSFDKQFSRIYHVKILKHRRLLTVTKRAIANTVACRDWSDASIARTIAFISIYLETPRELGISVATSEPWFQPSSLHASSRPPCAWPARQGSICRTSPFQPCALLLP